jgi:senataxin
MAFSIGNSLENDLRRLSLRDENQHNSPSTLPSSTYQPNYYRAPVQQIPYQNRSPIVSRKNNTSPQEFCKMDVSKIRFTQQTVSPYFTDGNTVEELAQQLAIGEISAADIPSIRVVKYKNQLWSLDNRRLRAFKDGLVETINGIMVDMKDPNIAKEFWDKKTSKSATESGIIRKETLYNTQHFESPIYAFTKIVLNWTFEQIAEPMPNHKKNPLPGSYNHRSTYYASFEPLIFEEARAILHAGIQEANAEQKSRFRFSLTHLKPAKKADNPSEIKFTILPGSEKDMKSGDVLLFTHKKYPSLQLIALTSYTPQGDATTEFSFKAVINTDLLEEYDFAFEKGEEWGAKAIGSLTTLQRMYEACQKAQGMEPSPLESSIIRGCYKPSYEESDSFEFDFQESGLNSSQIDTINLFLELSEGLFLVQGPPGTGKTTTIIQLLNALQLLGESVFVCAPANKAVQILAKLFMDNFPEVPIILVSAEDPPSDSTLNDIFLDSWYDRQKLVLTQIGETIWDLQLHKLIAGDAKFFSSRLENAYETLVGTIKKFSSFVENIEKYELTCLKELDLQQAKFEEAIGNYWELISSEEFPWEETALYYAKKEDALIEMSPHVSLARSYLSKISIILSSLQEQLQIAESNETSSGLQAELLNHSQLIFCTLSVSGQQRMKNITSINTLIVDEAGQATEAETLIPLTIANPQKCLLIGDIKQLPATVISQDAEKLKFGRSMMERLIENCDYPYAMLSTQYRMHPEISRWPSQQYYGGELKNHTSVCAPEHAIKGMEKSFSFLGPYSFININGKEQNGPLGRSFFNQTEVKSIALIIDYLAQVCLIKVEEHVAVISFYAEQIHQINTALKSKYPNIRVNTVDGFQGGESDIIIISCVRANFDKQIGFLKDAKRLNVALTRAKFSLIILGNKPTLMRSDIAELVADADERKVLFEEEVLQKLVVKKPVIQKQKNTTNNYPALYQNQPQSSHLDHSKSQWFNDRKPPSVRNPRELPIVKPRDPLADAGERKVLSEEGVLQKSVNKPVIQKQNNKTNNFPELCQNQPQSSHLDHSKSQWLNDRKPPSIRNPGEPAILEPREPSRRPKPKFVTGSGIIKLNRKTELCRNYALNACRFGNQCDFAHGAAELNQGTKKLEPKRVSSYSKK